MKAAAIVCLVIAVAMALLMMPSIVQGPSPDPGANDLSRESQWLGHILGTLCPTIVFGLAGLLLLRAAQKRNAQIVRAEILHEPPSKNPFA